MQKPRIAVVSACLIAICSLMVGLSASASSATTTPSAASSAASEVRVTPNHVRGQHSVAYTKSYMTNRQVGPSRFTNYGVAKITGWRAYGDGDKPTLSMSYQPPTTAADSGSVTPDSWWNPATWNWGAIMGVDWSDLFSKCLSGAAGGFLGKVAYDSVAKDLLVRGATVISWEEYAALAFGGCVVKMVF